MNIKDIIKLLMMLVALAKAIESISNGGDEVEKNQDQPIHRPEDFQPDGR